MPIPHWEDSPAEWDSLTLGAWVMPGVWTVDFSVRREMDVKKAVSTDGARLKDKGYQPPQLTLIGRIYGREEWDALQKIMPSIHPRRKGASRKPFKRSAEMCWRQKSIPAPMAFGSVQLLSVGT